MFGKMGTQEIFIILIIVLVVFGPTQLPKLTKMFGKSIKGFKEGLDDTTKDEKEKENSDKE